MWQKNKIIIALLTLVVVLTAQLILFVNTYTVNLIYGDQWGFLGPLFNDAGYWDIFLTQHGPHRQGLAFVITAIIYDATQWNIFAEAYFMVGILFLTTLILLYTSFRVFNSITSFEIIIPLAVLTPAFSETLYQVSNASHGIFPLFLISLIVLAQTLPLGKKVLLSTACGFMAVFTGFGIFAGLMTLVWAAWGLIRGTFRSDLSRICYYGFSLAFMLVALILFFQNYRFVSGLDCFQFPHEPFTDYIKFINCQVSFFGGLPCGQLGRFDFLTWFAGSAQIALFIPIGLLIAWRYFKGNTENKALANICFIMLGASLAFLIATTIGRVCQQPVGAKQFRYLPLLTPAYLALYYYLRSLDKIRISRVILYLILVGFILKAVLFSYPLVPITMPGMVRLTHQKKVWIESYLDTGDVSKATAASGLSISPGPSRLLTRRMRYLENHRLSFFSESESK